MHFVKFHPEVASCLPSRDKRKYAPLGMRLLWKYIRNYFLVYHLILHFLLYLQNYKEFQAEMLDLQSEKYELSFYIKKYTTSGWALGNENMIGIRAFKGTISDCQFQTSFFFQTPTFFCIFRELHCINLPIQQLSWKQHIFGKRDNSLLLGINYCRR